MKRKTLFIAALVGLGSFANAQTTQMTNDEGLIVTPEAGDWAIGFNASPLFNYVGNMFNGADSNSLNTQFINNNQAIYGKYFTDENTAYRASLRIMKGSLKQNKLYAGTNGDSLTNTVKYSGGDFKLGFGIEKRKGHNKLQGYYGAEINFSVGGTTSKRTYEYAATFDTTSYNAGTLVSFGDPSTPVTDRVNSQTFGTTVGFGLRGFIGAEYFFAPKISIAAEYGWGVSYSSTGAGTREATRFTDIATNTSEDYTIVTGKSSLFNIDTDNIGGAIRLMFHF